MWAGKLFIMKHSSKILKFQKEEQKIVRKVRGIWRCFTSNKSFRASLPCTSTLWSRKPRRLDIPADTLPDRKYFSWQHKLNMTAKNAVHAIKYCTRQQILHMASKYRIWQQILKIKNTGPESTANTVWDSKYCTREQIQYCKQKQMLYLRINKVLYPMASTVPGNKFCIWQQILYMTANTVQNTNAVHDTNIAQRVVL